MTVAELIAKLGTYDPEAEVHIAYNYGDYWRTCVAPAIKRVGEADVSFSRYHEMDKISDPNDDPRDDDGDTRTVVVLR